MDAVTYPDRKVIGFVNENYIPLKIPFDEKPLAQDFNIKWTPVLITLDADRQEHHRSVGFLDPYAFIASATIGIAKYHFDYDRYEQALDFLEIAISDYSESDYTAEAIYLRGVTRYKKTGARAYLKETYDILHDRYPKSEWTRKAYPYKLI